MGSCSRGGRLSPTTNKTRKTKNKVEIYRQRAGWGLVDKKLLQEIIRGSGALAKPKKILAEVGQGD